MTKKKHPPATTPLDTEDERGFPSRVLVPDGADPKEGIPINLDLTEVYGHLPDEFQSRLYHALKDRGLVEPKDFVQPGAPERFRSALNAVIRNEWLKVIHLAKEEMQS